MSSPENTFDANARGSAVWPADLDGVAKEDTAGVKIRGSTCIAFPKVLELGATDDKDGVIIWLMNDCWRIPGLEGCSGRSGGGIGEMDKTGPEATTASLILRTSAASSSSLLQTQVSRLLLADRAVHEGLDVTEVR